MVEFTARHQQVGEGKRITIGSESTFGKKPPEFWENHVVKIKFHIHDFPNLPQKLGESFQTGTINAHGHLWKLAIYPKGMGDRVDYVSIFFMYDGDNITPADPVVAKALLRTKTTTQEVPRYEYINKRGQLLPDFFKRKNVIADDCNEVGTLTITVELEVATEKRSLWYPQLTYSCDNNDIGMQLYNSAKYSDILFIVGTSKMEFVGHKCILFHRARMLCDLVVMEEEEEESSSSSSENNNNNFIVVLTDVDVKAFEVLLRFIYTGEVHKLHDDLDEETMKLILLTANRFGVTELKLYVESILIEKFLVPSKAAALLLFADAQICPLLKEKSMNVYSTDSTTFMNSEGDAWKQLQESNKLLVELLVYTNNIGGRPRYSSVVDDGYGTVEEVDELDVTSLRERLQQAKLDVDGSRSMLVERWKDYLRSHIHNNNSSNDNNNNTETLVS